MKPCISLNDHPDDSSIKQVDEYYDLITYGNDTSIETKKKFKDVVKKSLLFRR